MPADQEIQKDRWPRLTLEFNNALHHYQDMDPGDGFEHDPSNYETYVPLSELEAEKEHSRRSDEEIRKYEAALDRTEDKLAAAEKALGQLEHAVGALLAERRRVSPGSSQLYLPDNPVTRERLNGLAVVLATHNDNEEDPNA